MRPLVNNYSGYINRAEYASLQDILSVNTAGFGPTTAYWWGKSGLSVDVRIHPYVLSQPTLGAHLSNEFLIFGPATV